MTVLHRSPGVCPGGEHRPAARPRSVAHPRSQLAVITDRLVVSHTSTIRAVRTATYSSVAWTAWPPGAQTAPARWPLAYSSPVRTSRTLRFSAWRRSQRMRSSAGSTNAISSSAATRAATGRRASDRATRSTAPSGRPRAPARARERPAHGPVLQGDDGVWQSQAPDGLGSDVAAGAPAAMHDDGLLGAGDQLGDAQDQLAARHTDGPGMQPRWTPRAFANPR